MASCVFIQSDAARLPFADDSFSLVLGSPPYCEARSYSANMGRKCNEWVQWMLRVTAEACRVSRGLVLWVCAGVTRDWCYWPAPEALMWEWFKLGNRLWRPCFWHRVGIPGSGGKQWLRADIEYVLAFTKCRKKLPWADSTANGRAPIYGVGGALSYRTKEGQRINKAVGKRLADNRYNEKLKAERFRHAADGTVKGEHDRLLGLKIANPGCLVSGIPTGGGKLGHAMAHENEAPYPTKLAKWFIRSWAEPGSTVCDPFSGSGSTAHAALELGRNAVGCDLRFSQCELGRRRCATVQPETLFN